MRYNDFLIDILGGAILNNATAYAYWNQPETQRASSRRGRQVAICN